MEWNGTKMYEAIDVAVLFPTLNAAGRPAQQQHRRARRRAQGGVRRAVPLVRRARRRERARARGGARGGPSQVRNGTAVRRSAALVEVRTGGGATTTRITAVGSFSRVAERGFTLATGGTDNHIVLWDVRPLGVTGSKVNG